MRQYECVFCHGVQPIPECPNCSTEFHWKMIMLQLRYQCGEFVDFKETYVIDMPTRKEYDTRQFVKYLIETGQMSG